MAAGAPVFYTILNIFSVAVMAISVLHMKDIRNGTSFPLNNYEEPFGTIEDSIFLPLRALERSARDKLVKAVFFSFNHLDEILSRSDRMTTTPIYSSYPHQVLLLHTSKTTFISHSLQTMLLFQPLYEMTFKII